MRKFLLVFVFVQAFISCYTQTKVKAPIHFESYAFNLHVTKDENLIISTRAGEVALALKYDQPWQMINPIKENGAAISGVTIDQANFFNSDTGFVSGFINNGDKYNIIYHTINGGKSYKAIDFNQSGWVDDAINFDNGEAWLSVSGSGIAYSNDFGYSWKQLNIPERRQRFASIFFNPKHEGIIGSLWNMIAVTNDNCDSWTIIPTPLDQKKYNKTNRESRPEINHVAIFQEYILCTQEGLVFFSKRDSINWNWLPDYSDFYTDEENSALFFKTNRNSLIKANNKFEPAFTAENSYGSIIAKCKNGKLFIKKEHYIVVFQPGSTLVSSPIFATNLSEIKPTPFAYGKDGIYGAISNRVFLQGQYNQAWKPVFTLPFEVKDGQLALINNNTIVNAENDSLYYFDISNKKTIIKSRNSVIQQFCNSGIKQLKFSTGSSGCFHSYEDEIVYDNTDNGFVLNDHVSTGTKHNPGLNSDNDFIDATLVENFVKQIPASANKKATIQDLGFTANDYNRCKKDITEFQSALNTKKDKNKSFTFYKNNLDFERLRSLVDSVKLIRADELNPLLFNLSELMSTTINWIKIKFINKEDQVLEITSMFYEPNAFYFPWRLSIDGYNSINTSIEINDFVQKACPGLLKNTNKMEVLHTIVKGLY
ncbi:MAG: hypothetical protein ABI760_14730 [Ferruginibacter sp.]